MSLYKVVVTVKEVKGYCPVYKPGDRFVVEGFYVLSSESCNICIHAFSAMLTLLSAFSHGVSAVDLGIGKREDVGYLRCPDPGPPVTCGGSVLFELRREVLRR